MVEAMVFMEMVAGVELGCPWFCWIGAANRVGMNPVRFSDEISVTFAIDDSQISSGRIVNVDFGSTSQAINRSDRGKQFTKLTEGDGDWTIPMRSLRFASDGVRALRFLGWVAEMKSFFDTELHESRHSERNSCLAVRCIETTFRQSAAFGCAVFENSLGEMNGIENLVTMGGKLSGGFDAVEKLHQRE